jgi:PAS domain S-box-containing protein
MDEMKTNEDRPADHEIIELQKGTPGSTIGAGLASVAVVMLIGMGMLEWVLQVMYPTATWGSHLATIVGASLLATIVAYIVLKKQGMSLQEACTEIASNKQIQTELEQKKVADLTEELIGATKQLREEMEQRRKAEEALQQAKNDFQHHLDEDAAEISSANQQITQEFNELKKAYTVLKRGEEKYRNLLDSIEDGYYEVDISGNLTFFNNALCTIAGLPREKLTGMHNREYTSPETAKKIFQVFNKVYKTGKPAKEFDWEIIRTDGSKRYVEASVSLIKDSKGQAVGFRGIVRDITERKRAEEKLKSLLYSFGKVWTK